MPMALYDRIERKRRTQNQIFNTAEREDRELVSIKEVGKLASLGESTKFRGIEEGSLDKIKFEVINVPMLNNIDVEVNVTEEFSEAKGNADVALEPPVLSNFDNVDVSVDANTIDAVSNTKFDVDLNPLLVKGLDDVVVDNVLSNDSTQLNNSVNVVSERLNDTFTSSLNVETLPEVTVYVERDASGMAPQVGQADDVGDATLSVGSSVEAPAVQYSLMTVEDYMENVLGVGGIGRLIGEGTHVFVLEECSDEIARLIGRVLLELFVAYSKGGFRDINYVSNPEDLNLLKGAGVHVVSEEVLLNNEARKTLIDELKAFIGYDLRYIVINTINIENADSHNNADNFRRFINELTALRGLFREFRRIRCSDSVYCIARTLARAMAGLTYGDIAPSLNLLHRQRFSWMLLDTALEWLRSKYPLLDRPNVGGEETDVHRGLKAVVIKYLIENLGVDLRNICVEGWCISKSSHFSQLIPDVYAETDSRRIIADAKTAFGVDPVDSCRDVFEKYGNYADEVWCVVNTAVAVVYGPRLMNILKAVRSMVGDDKKFRIKTPVWRLEGEIEINNTDTALTAEKVTLIDLEELLRWINDEVKKC